MYRHHETLRYHINHKNNSKVLETCERYMGIQGGDGDNGGATLYMLALSYFADQSDCEAVCDMMIVYVIIRI